MWCGCGIHYLGVWLVGGAFVPEGPSRKLAPMQRQSYRGRLRALGSIPWLNLVSVVMNLAGKIVSTISSTHGIG